MGALSFYDGDLILRVEYSHHELQLLQLGLYKVDVDSKLLQAVATRKLKLLGFVVPLHLYNVVLAEDEGLLALLLLRLLVVEVDAH